MDRDSKARMECEVDDAVDLSANIPWKIEDMGSEDESIDVEDEVKVVEKSPKDSIVS